MRDYDVVLVTGGEWKGLRGMVIDPLADPNGALASVHLGLFGLQRIELDYLAPPPIPDPDPVAYRGNRHIIGDEYWAERVRDALDEELVYCERCEDPRPTSVMVKCESCGATLDPICAAIHWREEHDVHDAS